MNIIRPGSVKKINQQKHAVFERGKKQIKTKQNKTK